MVEKKQKRIQWKKLGFEQWLSYGQERGLDKLTPVQLKEKDRSYLSAGRRHTHIIDNQEKKWIDILGIPAKKPGERRIQWKKLGFEHWLSYGQRSHYEKLSRRELEKKNSGYYHAGMRHNHPLDGTPAKWMSFLGSSGPGTRWKKLGFEHWLQYGKKRKYEKLKPQELFDKDESYYVAGHKHTHEVDGKEKKWIDTLGVSAKSQGKRTEWKELGFEYWLQYGKERGYQKLTPSELREKDESYAAAGYRRTSLIGGEGTKWIQLLRILAKNKKELQIQWHALGFKHWLQYGQEREYNKLKPWELGKRNKSYYNAGHRYTNTINGKEKKWIDFLLPHALNSHEDLEKFLAKNPESQGIAALSMVNGFTSDVIGMLEEMYPGRFVNAAQIAKNLPTAVKSILPALIPVDLPAVAQWYQGLPKLKSQVRTTLENLLFQVMISSYRKKFNQNPNSIFSDIQKAMKINPKIKTLAKRVGKEYRKILKFYIPGFGKIK